MANEKPIKQPASATDSTPLAERLFAANWNPASGYTAESVAVKCLEAAETFERVRRERAGKN